MQTKPDIIVEKVVTTEEVRVSITSIPMRQLNVVSSLYRDNFTHQLHFYQI